jgi:hypothetical protein
MSLSAAKAIIAAAVLIIVVAAFAAIVFLASPLTGVGTTVKKLPEVSSFSFEVDRERLMQAERVLSDYARERGLKFGSRDIPAQGRPVFLLDIALSRETMLIADTVASPHRLDVRVSSSAPAEKWQPAVRDIQLRLQNALGREHNRS